MSDTTRISTEDSLTEPDNGDPEPDPVRAALIDACILQTPLLLICGLMLDGGTLLRVGAIAALAFWIGALAIILRRRSTPSRGDLFFIRWGFLLTLTLTFFGAAFVSEA